MFGERLRVVFPLALSIAAFILAMLALFAGSSPGQLEDMDIISVNVTNFGHDILAKLVNETLNNVTAPTATTGSSQPTSTDDSWWSRITATIGSAIDSGEAQISDEARKLLGNLNDLANNATDKILDELEVAQWYSLHVMTLCQGDLDKNITVNCTAKQAGFRLELPDLSTQDLDQNVTDVVKEELNEQIDKLDSGTIKTFLQGLVQKLPKIPVPEEELKIPDDVSNAVQTLNDALLALFIFFVLGAGFAGLAILFSLVAFFSTSRIISLVNVITAGLAAVCLAVAAVITTIMAKKVEVINDKGQLIGITANAGTKFMAVIWAAFGTMFLAFIFWLVPSCNGRRASRRAHPVDREKVAAKQSMDSGRSQTRFFGRHR